MNILTNITAFLTYSNCWISLAAALFTWKFYWITGIQPNYKLIGFVFFSTLLTYTFQRYIKLKDNRYGTIPRFDWMNRNIFLVKLTLIASAVGTIWTGLYLSFSTYYLLLFLAFLSFFYIVKIPGLGNLRDVPLLKIFLIGITWAGTSTLLPALDQNPIVISQLIYVLCAIDFLFIIAITIPFDIRDMEIDEKNKRTLPQLMGEQPSLGLSVLFLAINFLFFSNFLAQARILTGTSTLICVFIVGLSYGKRNDLYFSFWVDGLLILQPLSIYLAVYYF